MSKSSWRKLRVAVLAIGVGATACSDASGPPAETAVGVYLLQSINSQPMPYPLGALFDYQLEYTSSTLTLLPDASYHERAIVTARLDGAVVKLDTTDFAGHWSQERANVLLIDSETGDTLRGALKNGLLSYDWVSQDTAVFHYVYRKQ